MSWLYELPWWLVVLGWYVVPALVVTRIAYRFGLLDDDDGTPQPLAGGLCLVLSAFFWWLAAIAAVIAGVLYGAYRLATLPTRAERRARRQASLEEERQRVRAEARRLGLPMVEGDDA